MATVLQVDSTTSVEVADIFKRFGRSYREAKPVSGKQGAVMYCIENCRTENYGYHLDQCDHCGHTDSDYNSCRDRHCPKCQSIARKKWVNSRLDDILPVPHYHVIFTLPHLLHDLLCCNRKLLFDLLFSSSSQTLLAFGRDPKWLGGKLGFYGVLHTWGQTLWPHPHVHFIVPGGAMTPDGRWVNPRYGSKFLFPVRALSKVFRGKFIEGLKHAYYAGELIIPDNAAHLCEAASFESWLNQLVARDWVVYCKPPFGNADQVVRYIGRYTHRVAISNRRIEAMDDNTVSFWYKDYRKAHKAWRQMHLEAHEFIRRFLWHVLPQGYHKIRHYGFLANSCRKAMMILIRSVLQTNSDPGKERIQAEPGIKCTVCGLGRLRARIVVDRLGRLFFTGFDFKTNAAYDTS